MTHTELETAYIALCKAVEADARQIAGKCGAGYLDAAGEAAVSLAQKALTTRLQHEMQREQSAPDRFSLAMLKIHAETGSNSETGWEREE